MPKTNDNPDLDFEALLSEEEEVEDTETEGEEEEEESSETDPEEVEEEEEDEEEGDIDDKFKGKTAKEVVDMYRNLESSVDKRAVKKAQELLAKSGLKLTDMPKKEEEEEDDFDLTDEQIKKMTPREFAKWADGRIAKKATKIASDQIARSNEVRRNVSKEIAQTLIKHPHLKTNKEYRAIVLDSIEASKSRGKNLSLKEACAQVDKAMSIKVEEKKEVKKKPRTAMEKNEGIDPKPEKDKDDVVQGIMDAGGKGGQKLGGLGF